ncbi:unnamed protein product [Soboliphyme baturini]|uniref:Uncharacterized protein n=1 Tax=Soboliphyme baturini TaxID=241478 RepID=A0A183IQM2_9BILA|nr:unnamed protein product [Soboliphyme baturini]
MNCQEQTALGFPVLDTGTEAAFRYDRLVKLVQQSSHTSGLSAERCIWVYVHDMYEKCSFIPAKYFDVYRDICDFALRCLCPESKPNSPPDVCPSLDEIVQDETLNAMFQAPKCRIEQSYVQRLMENPDARYGFVCGAVMAVTKLYAEPEKIFDLARLCADITALLPTLSSDWLGLLKALCCSGTLQAQQKASPESSYTELLAKIDVIMSSVIFGQEDFVLHIAMPSLLPMWKHSGASNKVDPVAASAAKLALHLLNALFPSHDCEGRSKFVCIFLAAKLTTFLIDEASPADVFLTRNGGERYLVCSSHDGMVPDAILTLLIAIMMLEDNEQSCPPVPKATDGVESNLDKLLNMALDGESSSNAPRTSTPLSDNVVEGRSLSDMAKEILTVICQQHWIKQKFLHSTDLFDPKRLLNPLVSPSKVRFAFRLLYNEITIIIMINSLITILMHQ